MFQNTANLPSNQSLTGNNAISCTIWWENVDVEAMHVSSTLKQENATCDI